MLRSKVWNNKASDIKLVYLYSTINMMHGRTLGWTGFSLHKETTPPQPNHTVTPTHMEPEKYNTRNKSTLSRKLLKMDVLTFETCRPVNGEIIKRVTSSWSIFIQLGRNRVLCLLALTVLWGNCELFADFRQEECCWYYFLLFRFFPQQLPRVHNWRMLAAVVEWLWRGYVVSTDMSTLAHIKHVTRKL
jgi:hypothetical protein